jgi:hypothetical protein
MSNEPHYVLKEVNLGEAAVRIAVFDQYGDFQFDSFIIFEPSETSSKGWEVWYTEWSEMDAENLGNPDLGDVKRKLIEIHSDWVTSVEHVHLVCQCLAMGYEVGAHDGRNEMQSSFRYALAALSGSADNTELFEAAHQNRFAANEDGSSFAKGKR